MIGTRIRSRLLNAWGAVLLVALAALAVAVFSALDIARTNAAAVESARTRLEASTSLWERLGDLEGALFDRAVSGRAPAPERLAELGAAVARALGEAEAAGEHDRELLATLRHEFGLVLDAVRRASPQDASLDPALPLQFERTRALCVELARRHLDAVEASAAAARERAAKVAWLLAAVALATVAIGAWASLRLARTITRPVQRLVTATERLAQGEFPDPLPASGVRELDQLGRGFDSMAVALRELREADVGRLTQAQRRIDTVLERIDDGLAIFDAAARLQRANAVALRQLGLAPEAIGALDAAALPEPALAAALPAVLASPDGTVQRGELRRGEGESPRVLEWSLAAFPDGARRGAVLVLRDVTDRAAFEQLRTQFVLRASHELRTPLTGIRMAVDLLLKRLRVAPESREAELLDTVRGELARLGRLLADLLDLSRLYARSAPLERQPIDVRELLESVRRRFAVEAEAGGVTLAADVAGPAATVVGDRLRLERVFDNLVGNALRHTPAGGRVMLRAEVADDAVAFAVVDSGEGIPEAQLARLFEPFTQFGERAGGAGLGLALCREIVARHGGEIAVESAPGRGARFHFRLPRAPSPD